MSDEEMNPYEWKCTIHGRGRGPVDECPRCLEDSMRRADDEGFHHAQHCERCGGQLDIVDSENGVFERYVMCSEFGFFEDWDVEERLEHVCRKCHVEFQAWLREGKGSVKR